MYDENARWEFVYEVFLWTKQRGGGFVVDDAEGHNSTYIYYMLHTLPSRVVNRMRMKSDRGCNTLVLHIRLTVVWITYIVLSKNISRTSAVSSTNLGSTLIFASCVVGTCNILFTVYILPLGHVKSGPKIDSGVCLFDSMMLGT